MSRVILLLIAAVIAYFFWQELKRRPPVERRKLLIHGSFWTLLILVVAAVATGRLHWLAAAITAAIPVIKGLFGIAVRSLPFLQLFFKERGMKNQQQKSETSSQQSNIKLSEDDAWQMLGLKSGASREEIIEAHKKLIHKLHPDRGGNDYLAAQLNAARDLLLKNL